MSEYKKAIKEDSGCKYCSRTKPEGRWDKLLTSGDQDCWA